MHIRPFRMQNIVIIVVGQMLSIGIVCAQQLTPSVISSSGGFSSTSAGMLSFTTGELAAVETYTQPQAILTQGFQQPTDIGTYVIDHPRIAFEFGVYPNPSDGHIHLITESSEPVDLDLRITDLLGRPVYQERLHHDGQSKLHPLDLHLLPPGMYLLTLAIQAGEAIHAEHTIKIQIID